MIEISDFDHAPHLDDDDELQVTGKKKTKIIKG